MDRWLKCAADAPTPQQTLVAESPTTHAHSHSHANAHAYATPHVHTSSAISHAHVDANAHAHAHAIATADAASSQINVLSPPAASSSPSAPAGSVTVMSVLYGEPAVTPVSATGATSVPVAAAAAPAAQGYYFLACI